MQKEIKVNDNGTVTVSVSVEPSVDKLTVVRLKNVERWLKEAGVKHGPYLKAPLVASDLMMKGVSLSGDFVFEAPREIPAALAAALGVDPSMNDVKIAEKPAAPTKRKASTRKKASKSKAKTSPGVTTTETSSKTTEG